jgi:hypothetical protein
MCWRIKRAVRAGSKLRRRWRELPRSTPDENCKPVSTRAARQRNG